MKTSVLSGIFAILFLSHAPVAQALTLLFDFNTTTPDPTTTETWNVFATTTSVTGLFDSQGNFHPSARILFGSNDNGVAQGRWDSSNFAYEVTSDFFTYEGPFSSGFRVKGLAALSTRWDVELISVSDNPLAAPAEFSLNNGIINPDSHPTGVFDAHTQGWIAQESIRWTDVQILASDGGQITFDVVSETEKAFFNGLIITAVPEPSRALLSLVGLAAIGLRRRRS